MPGSNSLDGSENGLGIRQIAIKSDETTESLVRTISDDKEKNNGILQKHLTYLLRRCSLVIRHGRRN